jgi:hypothetical protein
MTLSPLAVAPADFGATPPAATAPGNGCFSLYTSSLRDKAFFHVEKISWPMPFCFP